MKNKSDSSDKFLEADEPWNREELLVSKDALDLVVRASTALLQGLLVIVEVLHALPEILVEPALALLLQPALLKLVEVSPRVLHEEAPHVRVVLVASLVVVTGEVHSLGEHGNVVLSHLYNVLELASKFLNQN